ncbi:hypothetical protein MCOR25_000617 [Pyricularia grisea]|uniref:Ribosomal protein/NADH dehydrogenase domain-containing protein n=1 Tax=Pyricularia grisea TaxID=148305 RepID=A0A6P8AVV9_PYRGI|nr:uncharacterized protein PgNI_08125 [Pyricularia grisea]KAI6382616.1 hypothetical protein MCOR25_000617 [Pyricularia grisea]TLD06368.1 hypothetical protein PgNI_08125 [Pyricularia grisea]
MVSVIRRMNVLKRKLYSIRHGPGAAQLPPEISRLHFEFPMTRSLAKLGPRKFWRHYLPQLKYHNPAVPMILNRLPDTPEDPKPALLSIYLRTPTTTTTTTTTPSRKASQPQQIAEMKSATDGSSPAPPPLEDETVVTIDATKLKAKAILKQLLVKTGAKPAPGPTAQELAEKAELDAMVAQAEVDRQVQIKFREQQQLEKAALDRVKREAAEMKAAAKEM